MPEVPYPEVTLLRGSSKEEEPGRKGGASSEAAPKRTRKSSAPEKQPEKKGAVEPDERLRHVTAILLLLGALLLLLAIVSYTPRDQANADVRFGDLFGLFSNDPAVSAKADTTENWLGLLGAFISNLLINATVGYSTVLLPGLTAIWGVTIFRGRNYRRTLRISLFTLALMTVFASILGTAQLVEWMHHPAQEWSGAIGAFIASILTGLLGSAGSFLVLLAGAGILVIYAFDLDVRTIVARAGEYLQSAQATIAASRSAVGARLGEQSVTDDEEAPRAASRPQSPVVRRPIEEEQAMDEPARMVRRMRTPEPEEPRMAAPAGRREQLDLGLAPEPQMQAPTPAPQPRQAPQPAQYEAPRPAPALQREAPAPTPRPAERSPERAPERAIERPAVTEIQRQAPPPPSPVDDDLPPFDMDDQPATPAALADELERRPVINRHVEPTPPPPARLAPGQRLTVNVQEGESEADQETADAGELIEERFDEEINYIPPSIELLVPQSEQADVNDEELAENARILQQKLGTFNIQIENLTVTPGPVVTLYEFVPAAGIKLSQIESLADDIALAMKARGIRIIAPIPGKGTVGVEIPNHKPAMVRIRSVLNTSKFREATSRLPLALGKTTVGEVFCDDLSKMPHLLIAGATGSGKSVGINSILASLIYRMHPRDLKFVVIDPKKIELTLYRSLKDHFIARCPDIDEDIITTPQNAVMALKSLELEMDRRYDILAKVGQRNIFDYNQKIEEGKYREVKDYHHVKLPYIVLILDELADLMMTAAKEVEEPIARLAQLARAIGIHMVVATQRPSVDVITGIIKANFPARIAYQVASKIDSRTILDMNGAEQLLGNGDMLYLPPGTPKPLRLQNAFISTEEVEALCEHIGSQKGYTRPYHLPSVAEKAKKGGSGVSDERDDLFEEAARLIVRHQQGSVSLLQRRLKVGYSRAARIVDELEMAGVVGPFDGSKARQVLIENEDDLEFYL